MTAADFAARLDAKRNGDGWTACCPAHNDTTPSLSITEGRDGRVLLHCHAGCSVAAILSALQLGKRDLFADNHHNSREIVAMYSYTDEAGVVLFEVVRFLPKAFRQRRPDGAGGWTWRLNGVRRVLYRLPEVRAAVAAGRRVFVVEGEKDVDAVRATGHAATCNPGGAGKWRSEYTATLNGADVVIVADKDAPGRAHARAVATALHGIAAKVVIVEAADGKDVSDHLAAGRKLADLVPITLAEPGANGSDPAAEPATERATDGLTHIRDLLAEADDAVSWIVEGLLPAGGLSVFGGKPKGGKSTTARAMALRVARGEGVLGRTTTKGPVIYLGLEDPRRVTKGHFRTLGARPDDDLYVFTGARPDEALAWLAAMLAKVDPVLVVVDTLQHLLGVSDLNDYARVVAALAPVLALVRARRAHLMLVHHAGKGDRTGFDAILGSTAIVGTVDVALLLRRRDDGVRTLTTLQRTGDDLAESVLTLDDNQEPQLAGTRAEYDAQQVETKVEDWVKAAGRWVTRDEVKAAVEGRAQDVLAALQRLADSKRIARTGRGAKGSPFLFAANGSVPPFPEIPGNGKTESENAPQPTAPAALDSVPTDRPEALEPSNGGNGIRRCAKGHPTVPHGDGWLCPTCDPEAFFAALDAEIRAAPDAAGRAGA